MSILSGAEDAAIAIAVLASVCFGAAVVLVIAAAGQRRRDGQR